MPSPIKKFTSGSFTNKKGTKAVASKKHPIYAYLRNGDKNKGGWVYHSRSGKTFRVSIVSASSAKSDAHRAAQNPYPVSGNYRHTGDWIESDSGVHLRNYPSGRAVPPKKVRGKKNKQFQWRQPKVGKQRKTRFGKESIAPTPAEKKLEEAKKLKAKAVAKKEAAVKAKTPKVKKEKAAEAAKLAKKAQTVAKKVVESKTAPKSVKDAARATKRGAKKTESSAKKVKNAAAKAGV